MEEITKSYYAIIPANVRYDKNLKANEKLMYAEITSLSNEKGYCWSSNQYFAELYSVSKETVSRWISNLANHGYIKVDIIYKANSKEIEQRKLWIENQYLLTKTSRGNDENINTPIDENVKENTKDINIKVNNKRNIKEIEELIHSYTNDTALIKTINNFVDMRRKINAVPTSNALDIIFKKLDKFASSKEEKILILERSIENSWRGVFPLKKGDSYGNSIRGSQQGDGQDKFSNIKTGFTGLTPEQRAEAEATGLL